MFTKDQRGGFKYWFAHWCAYQMTALNLGVWKPAYLRHDASKPWLMLYAKLFHRSDPYGWVQRHHRVNSKHHLQHYSMITAMSFDMNNSQISHTFTGGLDIRAMIIDWECSRFTKTASPKTAREQFEEVSESLPTSLATEISDELNILGL